MTRSTADVGANGEFADAVGVFVGVSVGPEVGFSSCLLVLEQRRCGWRDLDGERSCGQQTVARTEPVADDAIDNEGAVDFAGTW